MGAWRGMWGSVRNRLLRVTHNFLGVPTPSQKTLLNFEPLNLWLFV